MIGLMLLLGGGCASLPRVENIRCTYTFQNIDDVEHLNRVSEMIADVAVGGIQRSKNGSGQIFSFVVPTLDTIDELHPKLLFATGFLHQAQLGQTPEQVMESADPQFSIRYYTIDIGASLEMTVRFCVTPGARLYYSPEGEPEREITHLVDPSGCVALPTKISKGQEWLFARTESGSMCKYIKINIFTTNVVEISAREYPR